jgi:putative transposase
MKAYQAKYPVRTMCRMLDISASGFYAWSSRSLSVHQQRDMLLADRIEAIHQRSRSTYGRPRVHAELAEEGIRVGSKRVARLMRSRSIHGALRRKTVVTTIRDRDARPAPDLVERHFTAKAPNQLWVADITYVPTWSGFLYLAVVLDVFISGRPRSS